MMTTKIPFLFILVVFLFNFEVRITFAGLASTWSSCHCRWDPWESWSECSKTCGGGYQMRDRSVWSRDVPGCDKFTDCASNDMGQETRQCNTQCFNGGNLKGFPSLHFSYCECQKGTKGSCCEQIVKCGAPSSISHGSLTGSNFTYNNRIVYDCDKEYNMTDPSLAVRTCNENGYWTGSLPRCEFAVSCEKYSPCINGGVCTNLLGDYFCTCYKGWTGKNCEIDIQPPELDACPDDVSILVSQMTSTQTWKEPTFNDPHGFEVKVTKNYPISTYEFPWGVYTVQYTALKPSNGLKTECSFQISVKPHPCPKLQAPKNGLVACNGWQTEYATVCKYYCYDGFALPPGFTAQHIVNCGATGVWSPANPLRECIPKGILPATGSQKEANFKDCQTDKDEIAAGYIADLKKSQLNTLCVNHLEFCTPLNITTICDT